MEPADVEVFYEQQADPVAADMAAFPARDRAAHLDHWARRVLGDSSVIVRTITVDGAVAGNVVSWQDGRRRFLGYWIGRVFWGRGVATEAVRLYLREVDERPFTRTWRTPMSARDSSSRRTDSSWPPISRRLTRRT